MTLQEANTNEPAVNRMISEVHTVFGVPGYYFYFQSCYYLPFHFYCYYLVCNNWDVQLFSYNILAWKFVSRYFLYYS